jgi:glycosyltransferase involved in cell wall biosynthesis
MKICFTNKYGSWTTVKTGKGKFVQRLLPELEKLGVQTTTNPKDRVDVDVQINKMHYWPKNASKRIVRIGPAHYDTYIDYRAHNKEYRDYIKQCHGIVFQSEFAKKLCYNLITKPKGKKETVIYNGASPVQYAAAKHHRSMYKYNFLASTREWVWEKRLKDIIKSFVMADIEDSALWVLGRIWDKPKRFPPFQKGFEKYEKKNVFFIGECSDEKVASFYKMADALIHTVYIDAQPNSIAEAICARLPVVCTDQGGQAEVMKACNAGILLEDKPYNFKPTNRRKLPGVNRKALAGDMHDILKYDWERIDSEPVEIKTIAKQYKAFFEEVLG